MYTKQPIIEYRLPLKHGGGSIMLSIIVSLYELYVEIHDGRVQPGRMHTHRLGTPSSRSRFTRLEPETLGSLKCGL